MNIREIIELLFSKEDDTDVKISKEEISGRQGILKVIFGKENVQDEELWNAGFGLCGDLIEVESENISQYGEYKSNVLWEEILSKVGKIRTSWFKLPDRQKDQIEVVMKLIAYGAVSLTDCVTVENVTGSTIQFLNDLGYKAWSSHGTGWIHLDKVGKAKDDSRYLTAEKALTLSNYINTYILINFLEDKKEEGKDYVIIPIADIPKSHDESKQSARTILESLNLDFELDTLVSSHNHNSLVFIDLRHVCLMEDYQKKRLVTIEKLFDG